MRDFHASAYPALQAQTDFHPVIYKFLPAWIIKRISPVRSIPGDQGHILPYRAFAF